MAGYPNLFPSGFIEFQDPCSGPVLYRNQPSRESYGPKLNELMNKYVTGEYTDGDFIRMATNLKQTSRTWNKLPKRIKKEFMDLIMNSNSDLAHDIKKINDKKSNNKVEAFGDLDVQNPINEESAVESVNKMIEKLKSQNANFNNVKAVTSDNRMSIFIIIVVAIVAVVIGFLIACTGSLGK